MLAPLHEKAGLNFVDDGPIAALERVRNWILYKQAITLLHPACRQTDLAACCNVGLK